MISKLRNQYEVFCQISYKVHVLAREHVHSQVLRKVHSQTRNEFTAKVPTQVWDQSKDQICVQVWNQVRDQIRSQFGDNSETTPWPSLDKRLYPSQKINREQSIIIFSDIAWLFENYTLYYYMKINNSITNWKE